MENFGKKCKKNGLTAYRIAKDTGVCVQKIANWMKGTRPRMDADLLKVLEYCNANSANGTVLTFEDFVS